MESLIMKLFEMKHIKKSFGALDVLRDISLVYFQGNVTENVQGSETFLYVFHFK